MGKSSLRRVHWCMTIPATIDEGRETSMEGVPFLHDQLSFTIYIGPVEMADATTDWPHRHVMVSCPYSSTRSRAKAVLAGYLGADLGDIYCQPLETTPREYLKYCWKGTTSMKRKAEVSLDSAIKRVKAAGMQVTVERVERDLACNEGVSFVSANQSLIRTAGRLAGVMDERKTIEVAVDACENMFQASRVLSEFFTLVDRLVQAGGVDTTCDFLNDNSKEEQVAAIMCLSLLPSLFKRLFDRLPGLFFWGVPSAGKSFLFDANPAFRKVAMDAGGVSRFRLEAIQAAFLLDDMKSDFLQKSDNSATLRNLTLGAEARVKVHGETLPVRAFVVATSNEQPYFLSQTIVVPDEIKDEAQKEAFIANEKRNRDAWKRRFICLHFPDPFVEDDVIECSWEHDTALYVVARAFQRYFTQCSSPVRKRLQIYVDHIGKYALPELEAMFDKISHRLVKGYSSGPDFCRE